MPRWKYTGAQAMSSTHPLPETPARQLIEWMLGAPHPSALRNRRPVVSLRRSFELAFQYRAGKHASEGEGRRMGLVELLFSVTTGSKRRRAVLTPLVFSVAVGLFLLIRP
jgi:hypothetical protein